MTLWLSDTVDYYWQIEKLESCHWGLVVIDNQRVSWTAFAILTMFTLCVSPFDLIASEKIGSNASSSSLDIILFSNRPNQNWGRGPNVPPNWDQQRWVWAVASDQRAPRRWSCVRWVTSSVGKLRTYLASQHQDLSPTGPLGQPPELLNSCKAKIENFAIK